MATPKKREELLAGLSDQARWLQGLQSQLNDDSFNSMLGGIRSEPDADWTRFTNNYAAQTGQRDIAQQIKDFRTLHGEEAFNTAYDQLSTFNTEAKKSDFYYQNIDRVANPNAAQNTGLTQGVQNFITGDGQQAMYEKRLQEINSIKGAYMAGQTRSLSEQFAREERNLQRVQRRYGITGGQAVAQLEDLQLRKNKMMTDMEAKAAVDLDARFKTETLQLNAMKRQVESNSRNNIIRLVAGGHVKDVAALKELLAKNQIKHNLDDADLQSWLNNKEKTQDLIKTVI